VPEINIDEIICNPGSERAILSIIFHNNDKILECEEHGLFAEHFAVPGHKYIFSAIAMMFSNNTDIRIDSMLIYNTITDTTAKQAVDDLGGMVYLDTMFDARVEDNLRVYINQVRVCAMKRLAYRMGDDIKNLAVESEDSLEELMEKIQRMTLDLVLNNESQSDVHRMGEGVEERLRRRMETPMEVPGYAMGWRKYDKMIQGHKGNELTVFVAESKTGKSTLLLNHAYKFSIVDGIPGLYIDTEMTDEEQEDRLISIISGVPYEEVVNGMYALDTSYGLGRDKSSAVFQAARTLENSCLYHVYMPNFTIEKVSALVRKYRIQKNIGYAIFDYIKLPTSELAGLAQAQEYQRLGFTTTCLKDLAGICNIPILTAAQANRTAVGNTNLDANAIGGSYRILQMATRLIFLRNKTDFEVNSEGLSNGNQKLKVAFQRNGRSALGASDEIDIQFNRPILKMMEVS
jgi:replicative DNA helicase